MMNTITIETELTLETRINRQESVNYVDMWQRSDLVQIHNDDMPQFISTLFSFLSDEQKSSLLAQLTII